MNLLQTVKEAALRGEPCTIDNALEISETFDLDLICDAAGEVSLKWTGNHVDTCSIVNARSGKCTEDCKWCAQSRFHSTGCDEYDMIDDAELNNISDINDSKGVGRISLVTSGRKVSPADIDRFCQLYRHLGETTRMSLCASMGLLTRNELQKLYDAGVRRYHCNLETSANHFKSLCTTHSHEDKLQTIAWALEVGMEVCSGGIIGMGESLRDRLELAEQARQAGACSIPVNLLNPIKGTPLENTPLLSEKEVILSVALMKLVAPKCTLRFAGGRRRLSPDATLRLLHGGISGVLVGDMLTTVGNSIDQDRQFFEENGFKWC